MAVDGRSGRDSETPLPGVSGRAHPESAAWREVSIIDRLPLPPPAAVPKPRPVRLARGTEPPPDATSLGADEPTRIDTVPGPPAVDASAAPPVEIDLANVQLRTTRDYSVWLAACAGFAVAALIFWPRGESADRARTASDGHFAGVGKLVEQRPSASQVPPKSPVIVADAGRANTEAAPATPGTSATRGTSLTPKRAKKRTRRRAAASARRASAKPGFLTLDARPYATIYVDGRKVGDTPIVELSLSPGKHQVRAVSADGTVRRFKVKIQSGNTVRRRIPSSS